MVPKLRPCERAELIEAMDRQEVSVTVPLRQTDGTYAGGTGSPIGVGDNPQDIVAADFNGDARRVAADLGRSANAAPPARRGAPRRGRSPLPS